MATILSRNTARLVTTSLAKYSKPLPTTTQFFTQHPFCDVTTTSRPVTTNVTVVPLTTLTHYHRPTITTTTTARTPFSTEASTPPTTETPTPKPSPPTTPPNTDETFSFSPESIPGWELVHSPPRKFPAGSLVGTVVSDKMQKTVNVAVERYRMVPKYRKRRKFTKKFMAHDEEEVCGKGDVVMIVPAGRKLSKHKHFVVREIIRAKGKLY